MKNISYSRKTNRPTKNPESDFNVGFNYIRSCHLGYGNDHYHSLGKYRNDEVATAGYCICPKCGKKIGYKAGEICTSIKCYTCGCSMIREELYLLSE